MARLRGEWFILAAAVLWGTTGTTQALAPPGASPIGVGAVRLAIGGTALVLIAASRRAFDRNRRWPLEITLFTAGCVALYQIAFFAAVKATGVAVGTMVGIGSSPVLAGALAWLVEHQKPDRRWFAATGLAILGCILLALSGGGVTFQVIGVFLALAAGAIYATYTLGSKRLLAVQQPEAAMAVVFFLGAVLLSPALVFIDLSWLSVPAGWAVALHLGLVATAVSYLLFGRGLQTVPTATAVTLSLAEPLTAGLLGVLLLGEQLAPAAWVGIFLLFGGLALLSH